MNALLKATERLGVVLHDQVPSPDAAAHDLYEFAAIATRWAASFAEIEVLDGVPDWVRDGVAGWQARVADMGAYQDPALLHFDIREDNLVQRPDGSVVFVDWGQAMVGPAWIDQLLARLERAEDPWFDASLGSSPALVAAGDEAVTAWLVGLGTHLAVRTVTALDVGLPTLGAFRRSESARLLAAAARRLDLGPSAAQR